jgi:hypothetical protein
MQTLTETEDDTVREDLADAVLNYVDYVQNPGAYVDFQIGITTTSVETDAGFMLGKPQALTRSDTKLDMKFVETLLCEATCFDETIPAGGGGSCNKPPTDGVTAGYLDCLCGAGTWDDNCGASREEPLEATFLALCRSVPNPPTDCFEDFTVDGDDYPALLTEAQDRLTNGDFLRPRATFLPIIVSDEGDDSRRMSQGIAKADDYVRLTQKFGRHVSWVVIGPPTDDQYEPICPSFSPPWGTVRYEYLVRTTNGLSIDIQEASNCQEYTDFEASLQELGTLLQSLVTSFPLQSVPIEDTILVYVDNEKILPAELIVQDSFGLDLYDSGWHYETETNAVMFHGSAIPDNDAHVEVFYEPLDGMPRTLPF